MTDSELIQELFDTVEVVNRLNTIINVEDFLAGRHGLLAYGPHKDSDPRDVLSCIRRIYMGVGPRLFKSFVEMESVAPAEGVDDTWGQWCPLPEGVALHQQEYPAKAIPLWSNGRSTVFCCVQVDGHGHEGFEFAVC